MGLLVDGVWRDDSTPIAHSDGRFVRPQTRFRNLVTADGSPARPATAASRQRAAIISTSRSPVRGRTAP